MDVVLGRSTTPWREEVERSRMLEPRSQSRAFDVAGVLQDVAYTEARDLIPSSVGFLQS